MTNASKISLVLVVLCIAISALFMPALVSATDCDVFVDLEIPIGAERDVNGLTGYVALVYQFVVSAVSIVAVIAIMYWGFRWATAAGNQTIIGNAKEGITSALIGLTIGLTSYVILFTINSSLVVFPNICPSGISFENLGTKWDICYTRAEQNSVDCRFLDYCESTQGCSCLPFEGSQAYYCVPRAVNELTEGVKCAADSNCRGGLACIGGSDERAGQCLALNEGTQCNDDPSICISPLVCVSTPSSGRRCLPVNGRNVGSACEQDSHCESLACDESSNVCLEGTEGSYCDGTDGCLFGSTCESQGCSDQNGNFDCCLPKNGGDDCDENNGCPSNMFCVFNDRGLDGTCQTGEAGQLCDGDYQCAESAPYCIDNDGSPGLSTCYDGEAGARCDNHEDCVDGSCQSNICQAEGTSGGLCETDADCTSADAPYCAYNRCSEGGVGDRCEDASDCAEGRRCAAVYDRFTRCQRNT